MTVVFRLFDPKFVNENEEVFAQKANKIKSYL